ncbi:hemolysin family protein [Sporichthya brevicatena]|uniref:Hemolysin family protein n=1 Tax=Sporichthya brevicatena TaxID=171442 RepID=A0ABN1H0D0_9ACTN
MTEAAFLLLALALVAACGLFVAAEFSFVTVDRAAVDRAAADGDRAARGAQHALQTLSTQLSGAQVGITVTNLAIGFLAEPAIARLVDGPLRDAGVADGWVHPVALTISLTLATAVTMIFGELVPKNLAIARPLAVARATQGFQRGFTSLNRGPIRVLNGAANAILRRFGIEPQEELRSARSAEELASLVHRSALEGVLGSPTAALLERSLAFGDRTAGDIRTPRVRVRSVHADDPAAAVIALARETGLSRFPVLGDGADDVRGLVHVKQAVAVPAERRAEVTVAAIASPPVLVPDTLDLDSLSARLRDHGLQMAVVVDEYGGVSGVVTLEDLVEELVGEIADEHDPGEQPVRPVRAGVWSLSGLLRVDEVRDRTGVALPESDVYETVAGLVLHELGRLPEVGDTVAVEVRTEATPADAREAATAPARLAVVSMDRRRVDRVELTVDAS